MPHQEVTAVGVERERFDVVDGPRGEMRQIDERQPVVHRLLLLAQLLLVGLGDADSRGEPPRIRRERRLRAVRDHLGRAIRDADHPQFARTIAPRNHVDEPLAVVRQAPVIGGRGEALELRKVLRKRRCGRLSEDSRQEESSNHLKISFGMVTWTPTLPSTSCVTTTLPATLVS